MYVADSRSNDDGTRSRGDERRDHEGRDQRRGLRLQVVEAGYGARFAERQTCSANEYASSLNGGVHLQLRQFLS